MTNTEAKNALFNRAPVILACPTLRDPIEYKYISAIIYRRGENGKALISAELADKCGMSTTIANISDIRYKE